MLLDADTVLDVLDAGVRAQHLGLSDTHLGQPVLTSARTCLRNVRLVLRNFALEDGLDVIERQVARNRAVLGHRVGEGVDTERDVGQTTRRSSNCRQTQRRGASEVVATL